MTPVKPLHLLFLLAVAAPLLALWPSQDPAATDWAKEVDRACTATRYGLRLSAARKVAAGGAAAAAAIASWSVKNGRTRLPAPLVDAIAKDEGTDPPMVALLFDWARDRDFYWRASAFEGLARRAPRLADRAVELKTLFAAHLDDPAWLTRTNARFGAMLLGDAAAGDRPEADPRAIVRLSAQLVQAGRVPPLQPLLDALAEERTFLGVPWGQGLGMEANTTLKALLGDAHPLADGKQIEDKQQAVEAVTAALRAKTGQELTAPKLRNDPDRGAVEGIEILSCRNGDVFVQWDATGHLWFGIDGTRRVELPAPQWDALSKKRTELGLGGNLGEVICDKLRFAWTAPAVACTVAPGALPQPAAEWLEGLAEAVAGTDNHDLASSLRAAVEQFGAR